MLYHSGSSRLKQHPDRFTGGMSCKHPFSCGIRDHPLPWSYCKILFLICLGANSLSRGRLRKFVKSVEQKNSVFLPWGHKPQSVLISWPHWALQTELHRNFGHFKLQFFYSLYELTSSFHIFHLSHLSGTLFSTFLLRFRVVTSAEVAASKTSSGMLTAFLLLHKEKKIYSWFGAM